MSITPNDTLLNKYRIVKLLGEGGMARVWLAEEMAFGRRPVAIKAPRPNPVSDDAAEIELPVERVVTIALDVLASAHSYPLDIVHRAIKPDNILFDGPAWPTYVSSRDLRGFRKPRRSGVVKARTKTRPGKKSKEKY